MKPLHFLLLLLLASCAAQPKPDVVSPDVAQKQHAALPETRVVAVGDIMMGGTGLAQLRANGYDYPFAATRSLFDGAQVVIGNLETALTDSDELLVEKKYRFKNSPVHVPRALKQAGFNLVSLANNHSMDYGQSGLEETLNALVTHQIHSHGAGLNVDEARKPAVIETADGVRLGFLAYSMTFPEAFWASKEQAGTAFGHEHWVKSDVRKLSQQVDLVLVSFHWGQERSTDLRDYQIQLAHAAIDAGADAVIGHHPHVLQALELYRNRPIVYSLGNYVFGTYSTAVETGGMATLVFRGDQFDRLELSPILINNFKVEMQPRILSGEAGRAVYDELAALSQVRGTTVQWQNDRIMLKPESIHPEQASN